MAHHGKFDLVCERLRALISARTLPANAARHAEGLLKRLETPVRIAFIGPPDVRRAQIVNAVLGGALIPDVPARPTLELRYGEREVNRATFADGQTRDVADISDGIAPDVLFLSLLRKEPPLKRTHIFDITTDGSPRELRMALKWASSRADIFVWCSRYFTDAERAVWQRVDERFTDHAFLAICGDERGARSSRLKEELAGTFLDVIPVDPDDCNGGTESGVSTLSAALSRHAELGGQADSDSALLFLKKFGTSFEVPHVHPETPSSPSIEPQTPQPAEPERTAHGTAQDPEEASRVLALCRNGAALVRERARGLLEIVRSDADVTQADILTHCRGTIERLTEMLDSYDGDCCEPLSTLSNLLMEAEELLILLEIEGTGSPETDGACLMLQIRRAFEARAAA
ncbi:hypothetical protein [Tropicimonas isoalkanivorans]|uniref:Dynamin family protein n=1 Tax=Tropicimonas isoalkanivorans TaxID=441112 RepID=A0A1I1KC39_9RHOB|nr:hypothetical protein [Tropicimonas isoalkanivorans]SFC58336.1 hypothetical protein SAMN04488094_106148 [Tropicimonas isoalkanivorans]